MERAVMALLARRWWAEEAAPRWALSVTLPLSNDECVELINAGDARLAFVGGYGQHLRQMAWDLPRCLPFEASAPRLCLGDLPGDRLISPRPQGYPGSSPGARTNKIKGLHFLQM